jgi:hypothetical protein
MGRVWGQGAFEHCVEGKERIRRDDMGTELEATVGILVVRCEGTNNLHTFLAKDAFRPVASITHLALNVVVSPAMSASTTQLQAESFSMPLNLPLTT